ncbi:MAG: hypothetical protein ABI758_02565 [Candidatus Woesebacteria bacterium]
MLDQSAGEMFEKMMQTLANTDTNTDTALSLEAAKFAGEDFLPKAEKKSEELKHARHEEINILKNALEYAVLIQNADALPEETQNRIQEVVTHCSQKFKEYDDNEKELVGLREVERKYHEPHIRSEIDVLKVKNSTLISSIRTDLEGLSPTASPTPPENETP